jgi:GNAT superfamily N-acetyltransferase
MNAPSLSIRLARPGEEPALSALCLRSKAHWGYDAAFLAASRAALTVDPGQVAAGRVDVAEADGRVLGVVAMDEGSDAQTEEVALMFVDPAAIGLGVGHALLSHALTRAAARGARRALVLSDPQARGFYERMGARFVGMAPSDAIPGRWLPRLEFALQLPSAGSA